MRNHFTQILRNLFHILKSLDQAMYKIEEHRKKLYTDDEIERQDSLYESNTGIILKDFMANKIYIQRDYN